MEQTRYERQEIAPSGPPPLLLWLAVVLFFLLIVAALAGLSYFSSGQRLASLLPYSAIAIGGVALFLIAGTIIFRRRLPHFLWLWTILGIIVVFTAGGILAIWGYRTVLPPRYQEQFITEVPLLRALMPPTPQGGFIPTSAATEAFSAEDLLSAPLFSTPTIDAEMGSGEIATTGLTSTPQEVILPTAVPTEIPPTLAPTFTPTPLPPTSVSVAPTAAIELVSQQVVSNFSAPPSSRIYGLTHVQQGWNNCGPANVTMALSLYGWRQDQDYAASFLRPDKEDKNVSPSEIVQFINEQTGVRAVTRIGGDLNLLKQFIVNNIPVIIERSYTPEGYDWIGHYQTVVGYDDNAHVIYVYDSYLGTGVAGAGMSEPYSHFDEGWQAFNRVFIAIYDQGRESIVQNILGPRADVTAANQIALETARNEARANRQNPFVWFNMGTAFDKLGMYEDAARAFDEATRLNIPFRMLWYQFGSFDAYFNVGRYGDVMALVDNNLTNGGQYVEETYYWQGQVFQAEGQTQQAVEAYQRALLHNPRYTAAQQALDSLS